MRTSPARHLWGRHLWTRAFRTGLFSPLTSQGLACCPCAEPRDPRHLPWGRRQRKAQAAAPLPTLPCRWAWRAGWGGFSSFQHLPPTEGARAVLSPRGCRNHNKGRIAPATAWSSWLSSLSSPWPVVFRGPDPSTDPAGGGAMCLSFFQVGPMDLPQSQCFKDATSLFPELRDPFLREARTWPPPAARHRRAVGTSEASVPPGWLDAFPSTQWICTGSGQGLVSPAPLAVRTSPPWGALGLGTLQDPELAWPQARGLGHLL